MTMPPPVKLAVLLENKEEDMLTVDSELRHSPPPLLRAAFRTNEHLDILTPVEEKILSPPPPVELQGSLPCMPIAILFVKELETMATEFELKKNAPPPALPGEFKESAELLAITHDDIVTALHCKQLIPPPEP